MSENLKRIAFSAHPGRVEQQLANRVITLVSGRSLLPPPITIHFRHIRHTFGDRIEAAVVDGLPTCDDSEDVLCEVTSCLDPDVGPSLSVDIGSFREWALCNPRHAFAVRYQPLSAWLRAAHDDSRFLDLAEEFVRRERARLHAELATSVARLLARCRSVRRRA